MPLTREVRLGAAAAATLVVIFGLLTVVIASERPRLEQRVVDAFSRDLRTQSGVAGLQTRCDKVADRKFACLSRRNGREISYAVTFRASECWRASLREVKTDNVPPRFPRRLTGCGTG